MSESILCAVFRALVFFMRFLRIEAWLFLGRLMGRLYYYIAFKQNQKAMRNLKIAFAGRKPLKELKKIVKQMHLRMFENFFETLYLPYIDEAYIKKYVQIKGFDSVQSGPGGKHGVILLGVHAGSWELSNAACAILLKDSCYAMLAQPQSKYKKIDSFLNHLRESKGVHVIPVTELKKLLFHLNANNILGTIVDHGGQDGVAVDFFSKLAMTPTGSIKLAKKLGSKIVIAFMRRLGGPYHEMIFSSYELSHGVDAAQEIEANLSAINKIFEGHIYSFPQEYLWTYKRWKYSPQTDVLVLNDAKLGHLKQSLALARLMEDSCHKITSTVVDMKYKNIFCARLLTLIVFCFGPRAGRWFLSSIATKEMASLLLERAYDVVVSAGSAAVPVNLIISAENKAKSIVIMKPGIFGLSRFSLVVAPDHDRLPRRSNVLSVAGAVNTVNAASIKNDFDELCSARKELLPLDTSQYLKIGLLIGGDSKHYELSCETIDFLCRQVKKFLEDNNALLFLTTSRRTPEKVVKVLEAYFKEYPSCRLFINAARHNPGASIGGIFYLSDIVIVSGESISMVSEASSSGKYVVVFKPGRKSGADKVERFLNCMAQKGYIFLIKPKDIYGTLAWIIQAKPEHCCFDAQSVIKEKLKQILFAG